MRELRRRFPNLRCPVSDSPNFNLHDHVVAPVSVGGTGNMYPGGGTVIPQIMIVSEAGYIMYSRPSFLDCSSSSRLRAWRPEFRRAARVSLLRSRC
jgi:hypothetical protein